jgi:outer membrane protein TolC
MVVLGILVSSRGLQAQTAGQPDAAPQEFTLDGALQYAADHYPTITAALEQVNVSAAGVTVARSAYLPRLDSVWQTNRATVNNITGLLLPQSVVSPISGPPLASASSESVWGSAAGALVSWEPFDFGLRGATVRSAEAAVSRARADETVTRLTVQGAVGAAFLDVVRADQALVAAEADVQRRDVLARAAHTLVDNQLRPGAEASRADAERAAAQTRAIQARQTLVLARTILARVLGVTTGPVSVRAANLLTTEPGGSPPSVAPPAHPLAQSFQASLDLARSQEDVLAHTDRPRVYLQSSVFARGSGANPNGTFGHGADGLGLERANWAAGLQVVFPNVFDFTSLRARRAASAASTRAERARYDEALLVVTSQQQAAAAMLEAARAVAQNTPVQLAAARQSETQARARYEAGLASIVEVADTQSLLAQAEYQHAMARVDVWRALLAQAIAQGTLAPFVDLVRAPGEGR